MAKYIICDIDGCLVDTSWLWGIINQLKTRFDGVNRKTQQSFGGV